MKLLTPQSIKMRKHREEVAIMQRIEALQKEERFLIKSINEKRGIIERLNRAL